jgi:hypothetical protein
MKFKIDKIGIALAAYKPHPQYFFEQLKSIQDQTYRNWVCVVSFDSDPEPYLKDSKFSGVWSDKRFEVKTNARQLGAKQNFQTAIQELSKKDIEAFACADQDDVWFLNKLETSREELLKHGAGSLVHCDMKVTVEHNGVWKDLTKTAWQVEQRGVHNVSPYDLLIRNVVAGAAMLVDVELARKYPNIPEEFPYHDHWYAMVAACHGGVFPIEIPLYQYRQHGKNVLGVREYKGFVSLRDKLWNPKYVARKITQKYQFSLGLAKACEESGLLKDSAIKFVNQGMLSYISASFKKLGDDPALARALFARGLGQCVQRFYRTNP